MAIFLKDFSLKKRRFQAKNKDFQEILKNQKIL